MKNQSHWVIKSLKYIKDRGRCSGHCLNLFGMNFVSFSASVVWLSGSQPGVCRSSRIREADDPEWSLESHHQSPQSSGSEPLTVAFKRSRYSCQNVPDCYWKSHFGLQDYINCAEIWVEFTCRHFTVSRKQSNTNFIYLCFGNALPFLILSLRDCQKREVNTILADIIKHMTPDRAFEDAYPQVGARCFPESLLLSILLFPSALY